MPRRLPPGCIEDVDRHGNIRVYYRAKGKRKTRTPKQSVDPRVHGRI